MRRELLLFAIVGASGTVVNTLVLWLLHSGAGIHYLLAAVVATEVAIIHNFIANDLVTFARRRAGVSTLARFARYQVVSLGTAAGTIGFLWVLTHLGGIRLLLLWNAMAIGTMFMVNFVLNRLLTWRRPTAAPHEPPAP